MAISNGSSGFIERASGARRRRRTGSKPKPPNGWQRPRRRGRERAAPQRAVDLDRLARVLRARRDVAAGRQSVSGQMLVDVDQRATHRALRGTAHRRGLRSQVAADRAERGRAARGTSVVAAAGAGADEVGARRRRAPRPRRARRRGAGGAAGCAPPHRRRAGRPRRRHAGGPSSPARAQVTVSTPRRRREPAASARNDARSRTGQIRPTGGRGPWTAGAAITARPAAGAHAEPEAVLLLPLAVVRLERPLHAWPPRTPGPREWALGAARHRRRGNRVRTRHRRDRRDGAGWTAQSYAAETTVRSRDRRAPVAAPIGDRSLRPRFRVHGVWTTPASALVGLAAALVTSATPTFRPAPGVGNFPATPAEGTRPTESRVDGRDRFSTLVDMPVDNTGEQRGHSSSGRPLGKGRGRRAGPTLRSDVEHVVPGCTRSTSPTTRWCSASRARSPSSGSARATSGCSPTPSRRSPASRSRSSCSSTPRPASRSSVALDSLDARRPAPVGAADERPTAGRRRVRRGAARRR